MTPAEFTAAAVDIISPADARHYTAQVPHGEHVTPQEWANIIRKAALNEWDVTIATDLVKDISSAHHRARARARAAGTAPPGTRQQH